MSAIKNISLYIPHVFPNFDKEFITNAFNDIGEISHIDFVAKQDRNGCNYNAVYVHFNKWFTNKKAASLYENVVNESKEARLYYDNTWYWIVLPNTAKKHIPGERKPRIDLSELKNSVEKEEDTNISLMEPSQNVCSDESLTLKSEKAAEKEKKAAEKFNEKKAKAAKTKAGFDEWDINQITYYQKKLDERKIKFEKKWGKIEEDEQSPEVVLPSEEVDASDYEFCAQMDEIEDILEEEEANLISIDGRYVQQIEAENWAMRQEIAQLRAALISMDMMYQAEAAKTRAFSSSSVDL
jgi:hypothetical protein